MPGWTFDLLTYRPLTPEEHRNLLYWTVSLDEGGIGYVAGGGYATVFHCDVAAETLADALAQATRLIHRALPDLGLVLDTDETGSDCKD